MSNQSVWLESLTATIKRSVDILFLLNPRGTSVGAVAGVVSHGIAKSFAPFLERFDQVIKLGSVHIGYFVAAGILLFNVPSVFRRRELPKEVEEALEAIRRLEREGKLTKVQLKMQYLAVCTQVVSRVQLAERIEAPSSTRDRRKEPAIRRP